MMKKNFFINWFKKHGRYFPWRSNTATPFQILITEMLLRKTTAASVAKIWDDFFHAHPDAFALAQANEKELLGRLKILGFGNKRATVLKLAAAWLIEHHQGEVPNTLDQLLVIPSVGDYSARAVLCFAYNRRVEIVDNTVQRFLSRYYGLPIKSDMRRNKWTWENAKALLPRAASAAKLHNYGLLDFIAQVCKASRPICETCPLNVECVHGQVQLKGKQWIS